MGLVWYKCFRCFFFGGGWIANPLYSWVRHALRNMSNSWSQHLHKCPIELLMLSLLLSAPLLPIRCYARFSIQCQCVSSLISCQYYLQVPSRKLQLDDLGFYSQRHHFLHYHLFQIRHKRNK